MTATILILGCETVRRKIWLSALLLVAAASIALSRIAVGAHWPMDVVVGALAGVSAGWAGMKVTYRATAWQSPEGRVFVAAVFLANALVLASHLPRITIEAV